MTDPNPLREGVGDGEVVDNRYTVIRRIGSGGMADVYLAEDSQLGRRVALKVLHRRFAADQEFVERFRREASAAAGLQHPNVVQVFDRGNLEGTYYIAMEFLDGRTLKQLIREEGPLEPARAVDIAIQILRAARFAHKRGVIHRDLKPHNVIVDSEGRVKVTDFGIARAGASDMTETGAIMGTAAYLSPEQAQGHAVSASSDIYSIGILLYELLTGQVPFDAESAVTIALKQVNEAPVPPRELNPAVSPELEDVVLRALQKDPAARYSDADAFVEALDNVRDLPARPDVGQRTGPLTGVYPALDGTLPVYEEEVVERRRTWRFWAAIAALALVLAGAGVAIFLLTQPEQVRVPEVVGLRSDVASARLNNDGFSVSQQEVPSDDRPRGEVIRQQPNAGDRADEGATVTIFVSSGPGQAEVPDVTGQTEAAARRDLRERGFRVDVEREFSETVDAGRVLETRPSGRSQAEAGSTVTLVVSRGVPTAEVPDVIGLDSAAAQAELNDAGFETSVSEEESLEQEAGSVLSTDPAAGTTLEQGETVALTVATEPEELPVPDVTGQRYNAAAAELDAAGFNARRRVEVTENPDENGLVISQDPPAGEELRSGARVTLVVAVYEPPATPEPTATETPVPTTTPTPSVVP